MRPIRLELKDFASFREEVIDFDDVDLFVLSGPTGAGKSSVIDAMCFALYGAVPRYDNVNLKEPVIHRSSSEARVRFDFAVGGARYRSAWLVKRSSSGRVATEATLERVLDEQGADGEDVTRTLASGSRGVREAAQRLLGLDFDEFTKTVVLPQGAFAELLHGGRGERQDLLVRLLDLEVYREVGRAARSRAELWRSHVTSLERQLASLADATDEAIAAAEQRHRDLQRVKDEVDAELPRLQELRDDWQQARAAAARVHERVDALAAVRRPDGVDHLAERISTARAQAREAQQAADTAFTHLEKMRAAGAELPDAGALGRVADLLGERDRAREQATRATEEAAAAAQAAEAAAGEATSAEQRLEHAQAHLRARERDDLAATLAADLNAGDDCPVCHRPLDEAPATAAPADLADARAAADAAARQAQDARRSAEQTGQRLAAARATAQNAQRRVADLTAALADAAAVLPDGARGADGEPDPDAVARLRTARQEADAQFVEAERAFASARQAAARAQQAAEQLAGEEQQAWTRFQERP